MGKGVRTVMPYCTTCEAWTSGGERCWECARRQIAGMIESRPVVVANGSSIARANTDGCLLTDTGDTVKLLRLLALADSPTEQGLLRGILRDETDTTARAVYADWLSEHGRESEAKEFRG